MTLHRLLLGGITASLLALAATATCAQGDWLHDYTTSLETAETGDAIAAAQARLVRMPHDHQAQFALGTATFFNAVEGFGQDMYRYGLQSNYESWLLGGAPFLRLPVPNNPSPEPVTYEKLRQSLRKFVSGLEAADAELAKVEPGGVQLTLDLAKVGLDVNADGQRGAEEGLLPILGSIMNSRLPDDMPALVVDFDQSDVVWLRAYAHLVASMGDFMLGYDWKSGYDVAFFGLFPFGEFPDSPIIEKVRADYQRLMEIGPTAVPPVGINEYQDPEKWAEWLKTPEGMRYAESRQIYDSIRNGGVADLIGFIHEAHWPVVEPDRLAASHAHLKSMVALSRANWQSVQAETDAGREWIPNLKQQGVLPGMVIDQGRIEGWAMMLDQFDGILDGDLLIPHWRFTEGMNLKRFLLEPTTFDLVLLLQGSTAVPYLEKGKKIDGESWRTISTLMGGDFMRYFLWIN